MKPTFDGTMKEFEQIVTQNKLLLYSIVYGITGSLDADDIVQDTFIHAYYHFDKLKDKSKLASWLCAIARNKAIDCLKRKNNIISINVLEKSYSNITPEILILKQEKKNELMREIFSLSEKYRETVLLYYFAEKSIKEISEILSVPEGTVKFRLSESRKKLKKELLYMFEEEKSKIEKKDIFARIREGTEKAFLAISENNTKQASDICDTLLEKAEDLSARSESELLTLRDLYHAKAESIRFAEGLLSADKYYKKAVEIAEALGDPEWLSSEYSFYAAQLSNMGQNEESTRYYKMALEKAEQCGKLSLLANCLYWNGIETLQNKRDDYGLSYFKRVIAMKDELLTDIENELSCKNSYALSYSAALAFEKAGSKIRELSGFCSTVPIIAKKDNGFILTGERGYSLMDSNYNIVEDVFCEITKMSPCLSDKLHEGYSFVQNTFSYSHNSIRSRFEVLSMNETITTPAGAFKNCLHTRYTNHLEEDETDLNKRTNGVTDIWYAPNIGIACVTFKPISGKSYSYKLKEYKVESTSDELPDKYLPLKIGNTWSYDTFDSNDISYSDRFVYENFFEVISFRNYDNAALIAQSGWCYPINIS